MNQGHVDTFSLFDDFVAYAFKVDNSFSLDDRRSAEVRVEQAKIKAAVDKVVSSSSKQQTTNRIVPITSSFGLTAASKPPPPPPVEGSGRTWKDLPASVQNNHPLDRVMRIHNQNTGSCNGCYKQGHMQKDLVCEVHGWSLADLHAALSARPGGIAPYPANLNTTPRLVKTNAVPGNAAPGITISALFPSHSFVDRHL